MNRPDDAMGISHDAQPATILVVEGDFLLRKVIHYLLASAGFSVVMQAEVNGALAVLDAQPDVQAIVIDLTVPGGYALAWTVGLCWPNIGIVATSTDGYLHSDTVPKKAHFLSKPHGMIALRDTVVGALKPAGELIPVDNAEVTRLMHQSPAPITLTVQ